MLSHYSIVQSARNIIASHIPFLALSYIYAHMIRGALSFCFIKRWDSQDNIKDFLYGKPASLMNRLCRARTLTATKYVVSISITTCMCVVVYDTILRHFGISTWVQVQMEIALVLLELPFIPVPTFDLISVQCSCIALRITVTTHDIVLRIQLLILIEVR